MYECETFVLLSFHFIHSLVLFFSNNYEEGNGLDPNEDGAAPIVNYEHGLLAGISLCSDGSNRLVISPSWFFFLVLYFRIIVQSIFIVVNVMIVMHVLRLVALVVASCAVA